MPLSPRSTRSRTRRSATVLPLPESGALTVSLRSFLRSLATAASLCTVAAQAMVSSGSVGAESCSRSSLISHSSPAMSCSNVTTHSSVLFGNTRWDHICVG